MASITTSKTGGRRIQFIAIDGTRKGFRLGKVSMRDAKSIAGYVESLRLSQLTGSQIERATAVWLEDISDELKEKLASVGLIAAPQRSTLRAFLDGYVLSRKDIQTSTLEIWKQPCRNLVEFFGVDKPLQAITAGDAAQFAQWINTQPLAPSTIAKRLKFARTFFNVAVDHEFISKNPFAKVKGPDADVTVRQRFVDRTTYERVMEAANPTWRTIIGLARMGGLRCPSEVLSLEWRHIDWNRGRVTVPSPKTKRYANGASREMPLFPELRELLMEAFDLAEPGETYVVSGRTGDSFRKAAMKTGGKWMNANLRTTFVKIIQRAGLEPWPKLFHNLRSSRETELLEHFPNHAVAEWLGHNVDTQLKHYAQVTDEHFERASGSATVGAESGAVGANVVQNPVQCMSMQDDVKPSMTSTSSCPEGTCDDMEGFEMTYAHGNSGAGGI